MRRRPRDFWGINQMKKLFCILLLTAFCSIGHAFEFNRFPAGRIEGGRLSWASSSSIKLSVGYGEIMGSYWEITPPDTLVTVGYTLTGLTPTANGVFHYLYVDRSNSSLPNIVLKNSTTAPTWSNDFMGWYNGSDRCIGAVWVKPDAQINYFYCSDDVTYNWESTTLINPGSVSTTGVWTLYDFNDFVPKNAIAVQAGLHIWQSSVTWTMCRAGIMPERGLSTYGEGVTQTEAYCVIPFERGAQKKCKWLALASSSTGNVVLFIWSYKIER